MDKTRDLDSPFTRQLIERMTICCDMVHALWSQHDQIEALTWIEEEFGRDWRFQALYDKFGVEAVRKIMGKVIEERKTFLAAVQKVLDADAVKDNCHLCRSRAPVTSVDFAVAKQIETKRDWSSTVASVALSAITLPLFGVGQLRGPGRNTSYRLLRLHLMLCETCRNQHRRRSGSIRLDCDDFACHPALPPARSIGYGIVLTPEDLAQMRDA